ncbi:MAG: hypothetical protein HY952_03910 [Elusimicrobia bacterium]|nr:hypothetical protein [Elusimicrobiota bacterium]
MKFSAVTIAVFLAAPAFAADWAPSVSIENISAIKAPAVAAAEPVSPKDGQNYSGAEELLIKEFGIANIGLDIPENEVMRQSSYYQNMFCFEHALRLALTDLLENYKNPGSPLARELSAMGALSSPTKTEVKKARQKLLDRLNDNSSLLALVHPYKFNQPQNGERVEQNWIFFLRLAGKPYWAVVDRSGDKAPYVYGL